MAESFAERWNRKERDCGFEAIATEMITCGPDLLPAEAAPCLSFDQAAQPALIWEIFGIPSHWPAAERERMSPYRVIGFDGAGNPICVEHGTGSVVMLDHEDRFRTREFVNSSVGQLAECLLAYMGERDPEQLRAAVRAIDPAALVERSFWWHEAASLCAEAEPGAAAEDSS